MAKFSADAGLAAMTQRAHAILTGGKVQEMGLTPPAANRLPPIPSNPRYADPGIRSRLPVQLANLTARFGNEALRINPHTAPSPSIIAARLAARQAMVNQGMSHPAGGDPTGGAGEKSNLTRFTGKEGNPQPSWGGWGAQGPGLYVARKFNATTPGGGSNTMWVKVG